MATVSTVAQSVARAAQDAAFVSNWNDFSIGYSDLDDDDDDNPDDDRDNDNDKDDSVGSHDDNSDEDDGDTHDGDTHYYGLYHQH